MRLRRLGHTFKVRDCLQLLLGQVRNCRPPGCPRSNIKLNDVAVRGCQLHCIKRPYKDAQNRLLEKGDTCLAGTLLMMSWNAILMNIMDQSYFYCYTKGFSENAYCANRTAPDD